MNTRTNWVLSKTKLPEIHQNVHIVLRFGTALNKPLIAKFDGVKFVSIDTENIKPVVFNDYETKCWTPVIQYDMPVPYTPSDEVFLDFQEDRS